MGKRSDYERRERDAYFTPYEAIIPLLPHLPEKTKFGELCAGDYRLAQHLIKNGHECVYACDIEPMHEKVERRDVLFFGQQFPEMDYIITNTPWEREPLHQMIDVFRNHAPSWLIFDADWMHTHQAAPYLKYCTKVVSVGRVQWIEGSKTSGMDNVCWYLFQKEETKTEFIGR